jgi:hypothetical protein
MPAAAVGLKKNLSCARSTRTSAKNVDTPPSLGDSEVAAVQHSPGEVVKPELGQRRENDGEISATVAGKKSGYVLDEDPSSVENKFIGDSGELVEEAAALSGESGSGSGDAEVLARKASAKERDTREACSASDLSDIVGAGDGGPMLVEDPSPPLVNLALEDDVGSGPFKAEIESADAAEQAADFKGLVRHSLRSSGRRATIASAPDAGRRRGPTLREVSAQAAGRSGRWAAG